MSDRMAAEIWIGGKLPRSLLKEFPISDLRLDWEETPFDASSEEGILAARDKSGLLHFADCEAAWGEFRDVGGVASGTQHAIPAAIGREIRIHCRNSSSFGLILARKSNSITTDTRTGHPVV